MKTLIVIVMAFVISGCKDDSACELSGGVSVRAPAGRSDVCIRKEAIITPDQMVKP